MKERLLGILQHALGISIALSPLAACIAAGSIHASLWLDEVTYWYYEAQPSLRELEAGRPGSHVARYFLNYFYCDIQRVAHTIARGLGLTLQSDAELYLRALSLLSFVAAVLLVYVMTFRESRSWWWSITAALAISASPLLLFYAFEARVSAFASLGVICYVLLVGAALRRPADKRYWVAGALLGIALTHLHLWIVCLFAALGIVALIRCALVRSWRELAPVLAFTLPGALTVVAEAAFVTLSSPAGGHRFPLYAPRPFSWLQAKTIMGAFSAGQFPVPMPLALMPWLPVIVLTVAIALLMFHLRRSSALLLPAAALLSLAISILIGSMAGYLIVPRYQVPLFAALFVSLRLANTRGARVLVAMVVACELLLLPKAIADIAEKGNGKEIAEVIESATPRDGTAIVVQHGLRLGYPDPLHLFVLHFYLDELRPGARPIRLYELPSMREVTDERGLRNYFGGGNELLRRYATAPTESWRAWLISSDVDRVWFVAPVPVIGLEHLQAAAFRKAMKESGFVLVPSQAYRFEGYPQTYVGLFERSAASINNRPANPPARKSGTDGGH